MRKRMIDPEPVTVAPSPTQEWLNLDRVATVEVTSEDPDFPIDRVFAGEPGDGWRAGGAGEQTIRIVFDEPTNLQRVHLSFHEAHMERTQEFCLSWRGTDDTLREIVRQQWSFSPNGSTSEVEDYTVNLTGVRVLQMTLRPDLTPQRAVASLAHWRVA